MGFDEQLGSVWVLTIRVEDEFTCVGGALCFREDGYLVTARHVIGDNGNSEAIITGRRCDSAETYNIICLHHYSAFDLAILKICGLDQKFPFIAPTEQIQLNYGDDVVCHGHGGGIPFSSIFGKITYPYQPCDDISTRFQNLDLTLKDADAAEMSTIRRNFPTPLFRTFAGVMDQDDSAPEDIKCIHPYLPLIEVNFAGIKAFSGCPVFRMANDEMVGIFSFGYGSTYVIPAQVICYAIQQLSGIMLAPGN